ncbi:MAG: zf-HC2 domain-containing protein [Dehalococcoidales bacterium]
MKCNDVKKLIPAFIDGEVDDKERAEITEHLSACQSCSNEMTLASEFILKLHNTSIAITNENNPPSNSWSALQQRIIREENKKSKQGIADTIRKLIDSIFPTKNIRLTLRATTIIGLSLLLSLGLLFTVPTFLQQDYKALAADISLNAPAVQNIINEKEITTVSKYAIGKADDRGHMFVVLVGDDDYILISEVNIETEEVVRLYEIELDDHTKQAIIDIAATDSGIQNFIEQGAHPVKFGIHWGYGLIDATSADGTLYKEGKLYFMGNVRFELEDRFYSCYVNLTEGYVDNAFTPSVIPDNNIFTPLAYVMHLLGIAIIISFLLQNTVLIKISGIISIIFAILGMLCGLFAIQWTTMNLLGTFSIPVFGSIIGAIGIKKNRGHINKVLSILGIALGIIVFILDIIFFGIGIIVLEPPF